MEPAEGGSYLSWARRFGRGLPAAKELNVSSTLRPVPRRPGSGDRAAVAGPRPLGIVPVLAVPRTPLEATLEVMDGRFKTLIVWHLFWGGRSFGQLMRSTAGLTKKGLRQQLAEMEQHGI